MSIINRRRRDVCVFLPNKDQLDITVGVRARGHDIFSRVSDLLDVKEVHLFGLTILRDDEHVFLDLEQKLTRYFGNKWRRNSRKDPLHLFLKVQFFIDPSQLILYNRAQQIYYADMRQRVLSSQCFHQEALFFQLAAYALQADLGDLSPEQEGDTSKGKKVGHYFLPQDYFPPWVVKRRGRDYLVLHTPGLHGDLRGMTQRDALLLFIKEASSLQDVPVTMYRM